MTRTCTGSVNGQNSVRKHFGGGQRFLAIINLIQDILVPEVGVESALDGAGLSIADYIFAVLSQGLYSDFNVGEVIKQRRKLRTGWMPVSFTSSDLLLRSDQFVYV
uniref:(northern house mosquito) hypothetical protein n=1 Tax=Culex pipiens TaxID=7175 RepID=A0A8D8IFI1_CULPI